ncbi:MAG: ATP-dependent DNA helicase RecG, partial [Anaerolineales bacterium]
MIKLTKFLRLEEERGFDNRAVMGGLHQMLEPWVEEAKAGNLPDTIIEVVASRLRDYGHLSENSRKEILLGLWQRLASEFPDITPPSSMVAANEAADESGQPHEAIPAPQKEESSEIKPSTEQPKPVEKTEKKPDAKPQGPPPALEAPLTSLPGIGPKSAKTLAKLDLHTLGDLLWHLPRRYDDYSQLKSINRLWYGEDVTIIAAVDEVHTRNARGGKMKLVEAVVSDGTGSLKITWFNQPWVADKLKEGIPIVLSGKIEQYLGRLTMNNPEWEQLSRNQLHTNRIVPVYPLTSGVSAKWLRKRIHTVVNRLAPRVLDPLPQSVRSSANLMGLSEALMQVHFPDGWDEVKRAQHRLAFDEMFMLQLGLQRQKHAWEIQTTEPMPLKDDWLDRFLGALPYQLTAAQQSALEDIRRDLESTTPMNRLLQGDVGSGKTVVAAAAIGIAHQAGAQSALLAPTSILAEQHYQTVQQLLTEELGFTADTIGLLTGATPASEREILLDKLNNGQLALLVGTHALIEDPVVFRRLGLAIIDEQHRFGVEQRASLRAKGDNPNLLVMTATPIPRSLSLTIYGDLDLTIIDEMPPGRQDVKTRVLQPTERVRAHTFIISQLEKGHQAFIIYPLVEGSEKVQAKAAVDEYTELQEGIFANWKVGLLHGRMKSSEKEETMESFRQGDLDVLVSTSVVEVGVDIPNATMMLIEGANRFGLAQLHQFRGRVGRGAAQSYCLLIPDQPDDADNERLKAMEQTSDGFKLAEIDLEQRGPGDFFGTRQSG